MLILSTWGGVLDDVRRILKPTGRVIVVEDTYSIKIPVEGDERYRQLTDEFLRLVDLYGDAFATKVFTVNDWYSNAVVHQLVRLPMPYNFQTIENWTARFEAHGFVNTQRHFLQRQPYHLSVGLLEFRVQSPAASPLPNDYPNVPSQ